jgi:signal transduction histidine kinase
MGFHKHSVRRRSLRLRLLVLLLVPLMSLAGLWAFAAYLTGRDAIGAYEAERAYRRLAGPGDTLAACVQRERVATVVAVDSDGGQGRAEVVAGRTATDQAQAAFRRSVLSPDVRRALSAASRKRLGDVLARFDRLPGVRSQVDSGTIDALGAVGEYDAVVDSALRLLGGVSAVDDVRVHEQHGAITTVSTAQEMMMRENALVVAALTTPDRRLTAPEYALFVQSANIGRYLVNTGTEGMAPHLRGPVDGLDFTAFHHLEDQLIARGSGTSLMPLAEPWQATVTPLAASWSRATRRADAALATEAKPVHDRIMLTVYAAGGLGLLALVASVAVSVLFGRSLARELARLQQAALDLAGQRIPQVIKRLRAGETIDVAEEAPPIEVGRSKEISKVADALTGLQRTAVEAAVGEARLRQGISRVFLNLAWRSQSLLQRQLTMLHAMERKATDPDALEDLFALDHLTTRMRRHAEGLVILSGSAPARGWRDPVSIRDVMRDAIAEVENHNRVMVVAAASVALKGGVVADVTHLLAELIENAAVFSPPDTHVNLRGEPAAEGYALEVEDRGIGMGADELAEANDRLAHPPEFDLADSDRLGLFIVGKLAARRGITVTLRPSPYGGTQAIVLLPSDLVVRDEAARPGTIEPGPAVVTMPRDVRLGEVRTARPVEVRPPEPRPALPQRIRQVNLVPQLRHEPAPAPRNPTTREPEEARSMITSLQTGWQRGRQEGEPR